MTELTFLATIQGSLTDLYSVRVKIFAFLMSEEVARIKRVLKSILES